MLYILHLHNGICQVYLNKSREKKCISLLITLIPKVQLTEITPNLLQTQFIYHSYLVSHSCSIGIGHLINGGLWPSPPCSQPVQDPLQYAEINALPVRLFTKFSGKK